MEYIVINGQKTLKGKISVGGAKNAAVAILAAAIASEGVCIIDNLPQIDDVTGMVAAMISMGVK
jgi:UDP-N-acetylglucosamine 1-carboxyvinyltransferase